MRVRNASNLSQILIHVTIELEESSLIITMEEAESPYRIENRSLETLRFQ
jgi:hypothetical protein